MKLFFIFLLICYSLSAQQIIEITFNEPMDTMSLKQLENYFIFDSYNNLIQINAVLFISGLDDRIFLIPEFLNDGIYLFYCKNVKDVAGNLINPDKNRKYFSVGIVPVGIDDN